jgi:EAL domain-containing protein (putative c-di-GMP-specific phosphodiesterase class I)
MELEKTRVKAKARLFKEANPAEFDTIVSDYYDCVFKIYINNNKIDFLYISKPFLAKGIQPSRINSFNEIVRILIKKFIVFNEKEIASQELNISFISDEIIKKGNFVRTIHINTSDGIKAKSIRITPIKGNKNEYLVCLTDISRILDRDWMTDEYSRSGFISKIEQLLNDKNYQKGYSIIYANINGFKLINDVIGQQNADMIIFHICYKLLETFGAVLVARLEADHFAAFVKTENITEEKLEEFCHQQYMKDSKCMSYLIRCGIYNVEDYTKKISHMLDQAKLAETSILIDSGIPYIICNEKMSQEYINQRTFISELDDALKNGEFISYYQPIVDIKTHKIVSAEALIRWNHSEKGFLPPGQFIPVFEKEGLTSKLARFMINNIIEFNTNRIKNGLNIIPCSVNLSRVDFYDAKLINLLKTKLEAQENISNIIKFEITESAYTSLETNALSFLEEMKKLNLDILLDDFGSGMSSLSTLEVYDFDVIKLDMKFIRKIGKNSKIEAIIKHMINLSHAIGAKVVAEGVETKEQVEFLQSVDCDMVQGYYFYKPMPEEEFIKLLS